MRGDVRDEMAGQITAGAATVHQVAVDLRSPDVPWWRPQPSARGVHHRRPVVDPHNDIDRSVIALGSRVGSVIPGRTKTRQHVEGKHRLSHKGFWTAAQSQPARIAVVELREGVEPSAELAEQLIAHCRDSLARYKVPRTVDFRAALPRTDTGKLHKQLLQEEYRATPGRRL
jgi:acyl-CoA synthetase (AMP-forming)/AMP-acid ligase II